MLNGIDISAFQSGINIAALTTTDFVIVKATQGTGYTSEMFTAQITAAIKAGKRVGAYHYATGAGAEAEANHFLSVVKPYLGKILLSLDWETGSSSAAKNAAWGNIAYAKKWLDLVKEKTGITPILYTSEAVAASGNWNAVAKEYKLWGAQYANYNAMNYTSNPWSSGGWGPWGSNPTIQQYTSSGRIAGYSGNLDLNLFYGNGADWDAMCRTAKETYTPGWHKNEKGWWYAKDETNYAAAEWEKIDGEWYYFDKEGYMVANQWQYTNGNAYYLGADGTMVKSRTLKIDEDGKLVPSGGYYYTLGDVPEVYRTELHKLVKAGKLKGKGGTGDEMILDMTEDAVRILVIMNR